MSSITYVIALGRFRRVDDLWAPLNTTLLGQISSPRDHECNEVENDRLSLSVTVKVGSKCTIPSSHYHFIHNP